MKLFLTLTYVVILIGCGPVPTKYETIVEAAKAGDIEDVRAHLKNQAPVEMSRDGMTALHWAAARNDTASIVLLLTHGADLRSRSSEGREPVFYSAQNGSVLAAEMLIRAGAHWQSNNHAAFYAAFKNDRAGVISLLLDSGLPERFNFLDTYEEHLLVEAATRGHKRIVAMLLNRGADSNIADKYGQTALHRGITLEEDGLLYCYTDMLGSLIEHGARVDARTVRDTTPLILAARDAHLAAVRFLVEAGADVNAVNDHGVTPLRATPSWIDSDKRNEIVNYLRDHGATGTDKYKLLEYDSTK